MLATPSPAVVETDALSACERFVSLHRSLASPGLEQRTRGRDANGAESVEEVEWESSAPPQPGA